MFNQCFQFDELQATGNKVRIMNKMKMKNTMAMAVNFADPTIIARLQKVLNSMTPGDFNKFKQYLKDRKYLKQTFGRVSSEDSIINKMCQILLNSEPQDPYLKRVYNEFKENLNIIDEFKIACTQTNDLTQVADFIEIINQYNDRNAELFGLIQNYQPS